MWWRQVILEYWGIHNIKTFTFHFNWTRWTMHRRVLLWKEWKASVLMHFPSHTHWCWDSGSPGGTAYVGLLSFKTNNIGNR